MKRSAGRPKRRGDRGLRIEFWIKREFAEPMRQRAEAAGLNLSAWIRSKAIELLKREA